MSLRGQTHLIWSMQTQLLLYRHCSILLILLYPPVLKCKALVPAHFPADGLTGKTPNVLCPLPNLWGEKKKEHMKPISQSVIRRTGLGNGKNMYKTEIDFICFSISSHSLSGTRCHLLFSGQAWGSIADQIQCRIRSTVEQTCKDSEQSFSD